MPFIRSSAKSLFIVLLASSFLAGQEVYFDKPIGEKVNTSRLFWKKIYDEIESTSTVIFDGFTLTIHGIYKNERVPKALDSLQKAVPYPKRLRMKQGRKGFISDAIARARHYPFIADTLRKYDLHPDLKWLPVLESGYLEDLVSVCGAKGLWQFMETTGKNYGLSPREIVDPHASTGAFARYFTAIYKETKDYGLAITSYNHGEKGVRDKLKKRNAKNIEEILPDLGFDSRNFYARFLAIVDIAKNTPDASPLPRTDSTVR